MTDSSHTPIYVEHAPHAQLARYIECYWSIACRYAPDESHTGRVLPDGCMDILFNLGDAPADGGAGAPSLVVGSMTRAIEVEYQGRVELIGVRFRAGGATPWLGVPAAEITDQAVGLEDLWGAEAARTFERLAAVGAGERIALLDEILIGKLRRAGEAPDERVLRASAAVANHHGAVPVQHLADATGLGRRQLERRFLACVGVSPKTASRIARFRAVVARMHADPASELAALALAAGYADQAHMNRDFLGFAGVTPGAYVATLRQS